MKWKKINSYAYEDSFSKKFDFMITKEYGDYILDIFLNRIKNNNKAYISSISFASLKEAKSEAECYL